MNFRIEIRTVKKTITNTTSKKQSVLSNEFNRVLSFLCNCPWKSCVLESMHFMSDNTKRFSFIDKKGKEMDKKKKRKKRKTSRKNICHETFSNLLIQIYSQEVESYIECKLNESICIRMRRNVRRKNI